MRLIIHRGRKEIGAPCVELNSGGTKLLIDFGMLLVDKKKGSFDPKVLEYKSIEELKEQGLLPKISGLYKDKPKAIDAILISHFHLDHYGLLRYAHADIPIYMSQGAKQLIKISDIFTPNKVGPINSCTLNKEKKTKIGDLTITAYLVDLSAVDARAFLIEAEGKRIFYSGDFRGHCRKSMLFKQMVDNPPRNIDCLLTEGSILGGEEQIYKNEKAVQSKMTKILRESSNITFLFTSSLNIDRLVSAYKACLKTGSIFVIDIYTAFVLDNLRKVSTNIPQFDWKKVKIKFLNYHAKMLVKAGYNHLLYIYNRNKIDMFEINRKKEKILMLARDNSIFPSIIKKIKDPKGSIIIYSMREGSLTDKFKDYCHKKGMEIEIVHTSGHAATEDLKAFSEAINPKMLLPIHAYEAKKYPDLSKNVKILKDKEAIQVE